MLKSLATLQQSFAFYKPRQTKGPQGEPFQKERRFIVFKLRDQPRDLEIQEQHYKARQDNNPQTLYALFLCSFCAVGAPEPLVNRKREKQARVRKKSAAETKWYNLRNPRRGTSDLGRMTCLSLLLLPSLPFRGR